MATPLKILFADDDLKYSLLLKRFLEKEGYDVAYTGNGMMVLEQFPVVKPDLVLLDINMPVMDGYEATREIRKLSLDVPIIAVTAFAYASDEQRAMENGFDGYMAKPISAPQLRQQIAAILQKRIILL